MPQNPQPNIHILYTGGTIGMKNTDNGYTPLKGHLESLLGQLPKFKDTALPRFTIEEFSPLLDSADISPHHWITMAETIADRFEQYDGFIVLHGTDTMAYTASALSFMLENLSKPVILTGSQLPLEVIRSDAEANLIGALMLLCEHCHRLSEVCIYFNNTLFRGNRTIKSDADGFNAFSSPNYPKLATAGITFELSESNLKENLGPNAPINVVKMGHTKVAAVRLFPGIMAEYIENMLNAPVEGVVLECFGSGNMPSLYPKLIKAIKDAAHKDVVVVVIPQAARGSADLSLYATGQILSQAGAVSGYDMTCEAALTKLFYLFGKGYSPKQVRELIGKNLRGELTLPENRSLSVEQIRNALGASLVAHLVSEE